MPCSRCGLVGHNKRKCQTEIKNSEIKEIKNSEIKKLKNSEIKETYKIADMDISSVDNNTPLYGNTFKNINELIISTDYKKIIRYITRIKNGPIKDYLSKYIYDIHYSRQIMNGNLTSRIKKFNNGICYNQIMKRCFNSYDIKKNNTSTNILNVTVINIITELNGISPSMCGVFIDYLIRRIISEINQQTFNDSRSNKLIESDNIITYHTENDNIWEYVGNNNDDYWEIRQKPLLSSKVIGKIKKGDKFFLYDKIEEWLKIGYKIIKEGWIIWKLPNVPDGEFKGVDCCKDQSMNIENKYIRKLTGDSIHTCYGGCKNKIEQEIYNTYPFIENECLLESCQRFSYGIVMDTKKYKTKDILNNIFDVSLCHIECFNSCPKQEDYNIFYNKLKSINIDSFINPLVEMCKHLVNDKKNIILNPALGGKLNNIEKSIPSDADLVVDDTLYDIKCTKNTHMTKYYEIFQLLGYTGLLLLNNKYNIKINNMIILNLLKGTLTTYDISYLEKNNFVNYIKLLTNTTT
jgi:hypothetical protein